MIAELQFKSIIEPLSKSTEQLLSPLRLNEHDVLHLAMRPDDDSRFHVFIGNEDTPYYMLSDAARRSFWTRIPERKSVDHRRWIIAATDFNALIISSAWAGRIVFDDDGAETVFKYLLGRFTQQSYRALIPARWRAEHVVPTDLPAASIHPINPLSPCQRVALATSHGAEGFGVFMEQGGGKTAVVISDMCAESKKLKRPFRMLVVCPKNVRTNWGDELKKFATVPGAFAVLRGGVVKRVQVFIDLIRAAKNTNWMCAIVSYEGVLRSWDALRMTEWDMCVLDESHYIKSPRTKRTIHIISKLRSICARRRALTGTPVCNSVMDLWTQLEWLGQGQSGFRTFEAFRSYYGKFEQRGRFETLIGVNNLPLLQERLARLSFFATKEEAAPGLPEKRYTIREATMGPAQTQAYEDLLEELTAEIEADMRDMESGVRRVTVTNILTKLLRLAQITSGFVKFDDSESEDGESVVRGETGYFVPNPKIELLKELVAELGPKEKMIIWATFVSDIKEIAKAMTVPYVTYYGATSEAAREAAKTAFNGDPACKVLIGNPAAGGVGLNLRGYDDTATDHGCNCTTVVYYSQNWSMTQRAQSEDRAHRRGTRVPVTYVDLVVPGTIDEEIRARVMKKRTNALEVQDLRAILNALRDSAITREEDE